MKVLELRVYWGTILLDIEHRKAGRAYTMGEGRGTDLFISSEGLPSDRFPLVRTVDGADVLTFTRAMELEIEDGETLHTAESLRGTTLLHTDSELDGAYRLPLSQSMRILVRWGGITVAMQFVEQVAPLPFKPFAEADLGFANAAFAVLLFHVAVVVSLLTRPHDLDALNEELSEQAIVITDLLARIPTQTPLPQPTRDPPKPTHIIKQTVASRPPTPSRVPHSLGRSTSIARGLDRLFSDGGALGSKGGGSPIAGVLADLVGTADRHASSASLMLRGAPGHGGSFGPGTSRDVGPMVLTDVTRDERPLLRARRDRALVLGAPISIGALDTSVIKKVIDANKAQVRYCYEIELQRDQDLEGRVLMNWVIGATGEVVRITVSDSTLRSPRVSDCLSQKIRQWRFPPPAGGGTVEVNYPFVFRAN